MKNLTVIFKLLLISLTLVGCEKINTNLISSPIYYSCKGNIEQGIYKTSEYDPEIVETIPSEITLKIYKDELNIEGDNTTLFFSGLNKICERNEVLKFKSHKCETLDEHMKYLEDMYKNDTDKIVKQLTYDNSHYVDGKLNLINNTLSLHSESSSCRDEDFMKKPQSKNSCGIFSSGKYICKEVKL